MFIYKEKEVIIRIKELTKKHNISVNKLAELSDIDPSTLHKFTNGKRQRVQLSHIQKIEETLDVTNMNEIIEIRNIEQKNGT